MAHVLVICAQKYNGHELWTALGIMQKAGHTFEVVSTQLVIRDEITLQPNTISRVVYDVPIQSIPKDFAGVMVVSGNMPDTEAYWTDTHVLDILEIANAHGLALAAICCSAPTIRYQAAGKRVSFYPLVRSRSALRAAGAILTNVAVSVDGNLVTAEHQMATQMWAEEFVAVLEKRPPIYNLVDSGFKPKGTPRKLDPTVMNIVDELRNKNKH